MASIHLTFLADTSQVTNMWGMFAANECLTSITLDRFLQDGDCDPSYVDPPTSIILTNWNTENVEWMSFMFDGSAVHSLDLSSFDTSKVIYMSGMFSEARHLTV